ncbi:MAG: hypothetical protein QXU18_05615, partial [Thermoplasmatales archaeon]
GTAIAVAMESNIIVHGKLIIFNRGLAAGNPQAIFPNGTAFTVNSSLTIIFHSDPSLLSGQSSEMGGPANLAVSLTHPVDL